VKRQARADITRGPAAPRANFDATAAGLALESRSTSVKPPASPVALLFTEQAVYKEGQANRTSEEVSDE
jgi:hypothetical protein